MDTIQILTDKIIRKCRNAPIFFITPDVERGIGLEKILPNYHIICIDYNPIIDYMLQKNVNVFCLEKQSGKKDVKHRYSNYILTHPLVQKYIKQKTKGGNGYLMFFKIAPNLEKTAKHMNLQVLNTTSSLNKKFELKISQYKQLKDLPLNLPKTIILTLKDASYDVLRKELGREFIIQFDRGHTGGGTKLIHTKDELKKLKDLFPNRIARIAEAINGTSYTMNACITKYGIAWGGLSCQLTGISESTAERFATVGNDFHYPQYLSEKTVKEIDTSVRTVGEKMLQAGFKGMFGIDVIVDKKSDKVYVIEINARQPASISFYTKLQLLKKQIPLNLLAIAEYLDIDYKLDLEEYNVQAQEPILAAQILIRNKHRSRAKILGSIKPGLYRLQGLNSAFEWTSGRPKIKQNVISIDEDRDKPLIFTKETYAFNDKKDAGFLLLCTQEGRIIRPNAEVARVQAKDSFLDKFGNLTYLVSQILLGLEKHVILRKITHD